MEKKLTIHQHTTERLQERFNKDQDWLLEQLEKGRFILLKGLGKGRDGKRVRSGYLLYIPTTEEYCVIVVDYQSKIAITALTEEMALTSSWGSFINPSLKEEAKRIALDLEPLDSMSALYLYTETQDQVSVILRIRTFSFDWNPTAITISKILITKDQLNPNENHCTLTHDQLNEATEIIQEKLLKEEILPYIKLFISKKNMN